MVKRCIFKSPFGRPGPFCQDTVRKGKRNIPLGCCQSCNQVCKRTHSFCGMGNSCIRKPKASELSLDARQPKFAFVCLFRPETLGGKRSPPPPALLVADISTAAQNKLKSEHDRLHSSFLYNDPIHLSRFYVPSSSAIRQIHTNLQHDLLSGLSYSANLL